MSYREQVAGLDLCGRAKQELRKGNTDFLGAHAGIGWEYRRYCRLCGAWHLWRHIKIALDNSNKTKKAEP